MQPVLLDRREAQLDGVFPRHEQRPLGRTVAQQGQAALELCHLLRQRCGVTRARRQHQPVGLHAQAPRFVHRGRAALELQRHPDQHADADDGQHQKRRGHLSELGAERPVSGGAHTRNLCRSASLSASIQHPGVQRTRFGRASQVLAVGRQPAAKPLQHAIA